MTEAQKLIEALSVDAVAHVVGVDRRTVTNRARGRLPAYWWLAVSSLAARRGLKCPSDAFAFARSGVGDEMLPAGSAPNNRTDALTQGDAA